MSANAITAKDTPVAAVPRASIPGVVIGLQFHRQSIALAHRLTGTADLIPCVKPNSPTPIADGGMMGRTT